MAATHHAAQRPQYSIPPPPPPSTGGYNDDLRLPSIKDLAFQYDRPRHEVSQAASTQGIPEYPVSTQERSARHPQAWGRMPHAMPAPSAIPAHQQHSQQQQHQQHQHSSPLSTGHEVTSKPNDYVVKHDNGGYMTPGIPLSAQVTPVPGFVNTGPGVRSDEHSQGQIKRARSSSSSTPIVSPRDSRAPHAAYPPQYTAYQTAVPPPSPYQMSPAPTAPQSTHSHPSSSHEHMQHHHTSSGSTHPGYISYQQYLPPRPTNIPPQHMHPHAPQHSSPHVPQHTPQHAPPPPPSHPQVSHPVPYSSPAPPPPPPPAQEHWESQHAQPVTPVHHHSHHHNAPPPPQPATHGHVHPHPQYSHPPPPPPTQQLPPTIQQPPQQAPPPQHHTAYQQSVHSLPPPPLPQQHHQQHQVPTRTVHPLSSDSDIRTVSYTLTPAEKATNHEKTMSDIVSLCSMLYEFATRYSALNGALPHVQPAQHEVMEMARRANEVVRLLEVLRRMDAPGADTTKLDSAVVSSPDDHRPPKRPWEDMSQDGQAQDDSNTYSETFSNAADIDKTTAEQDMEIIRTKRASTTAGAAASAGQPKSKYRKRSRATPPGKCHSCNIRETPEWRRGPDGARTLCNACGLHYAKLMRKQTKLNTNGEPPPPIDMDTLRASTRAADADKSGNRPKQDENISPAAHTPQHHQGSFQVVTMMPSQPQPENPPSSDANSEATHQPSIMPSPGSGQMHLPPPPPWAASVSVPRQYNQFQTQSFMRTNHTSPR